MSVERIGKFLRFDDLGFTPSLGIETAQLEECIDEVLRGDIRGVFGFPGFGFQQSDLDFLNRLPHLTQVWFWNVSLQNVDGLYTLKNLELFNVHDRKPGIDFSKFAYLRQLIWHYHPKDSGIESLTSLRNFAVWRFNPKSKTFAELNIPTGVERLDINWANPGTIGELPPMLSLKEIQFHYCRNLESLDGIEIKAPHLERVVVSCCKHCTSISALKRLPQLQSAFVNRAGVAAALGIEEERNANKGRHPVAP